MWRAYEKRLAKFILPLMLLCYICSIGIGVYAEDTASPSIEETEGSIYALSDWASAYISIPDEYSQSFQIQVSNATDISYRVIKGDYVEVSDTGLVTPKIVTKYWQDMGGYYSVTTVPEEGVEYAKITHTINYGTSTIEVIADGETFEVEVELCDYAVVYADEVIDKYVAENFNDDMTVEETLDKICQLPASYDYSYKYSSYAGMIVAGGGDCWASTSLILELCDRLGIEAKARNGNRDLGAGSGHMNALAIIGEGDYYELEAGYSEEAPRYYSVSHRTSLFSYYNTTDGIIVYQYDGDLAEDTVLTVPETIDSKTVVGIGENFVSMEPVREVILPDTIQTISQGAFNSCANLQKLHIPASVTGIGDFVFTNCNALTEFTCSEDNTVYKIENGILYDKAGTTMIYAPSCAEAEISEQTETIGYYAFYFNNNIAEITLPESVKTLEEGAFAVCDNLKKIVLKNVEDIGAYAFANSSLTNGVFFEGDAPQFSSNSFYGVTTNIYYPADNSTWDDSVKQNYYGYITWIPYYPGYEGLREVDGVWGYYKDGILDTTYTGMVQNENGWWYIANGTVNYDYTGMVQHDNVWWYITDGTVNYDYTGMVQNDTDWWYITNGTINYDYTGMVQHDNVWWYITEGKVNYDYTGMVQNDTDWWYITNGTINYDYIGMVQNDTDWWYITEGTVNYDYIGMAEHDNVWWYITEGTVNYDYIGMAQNENGWWYITNGTVNYDYTGMAQNENGWWYINDGKLDTSYTGLVKYKSKWIYVKNGKLNTSYTGLVKYKSKWVYVKKGKLDASYTGLVKYKSTWVYVNKGNLDVTFTGMARNQYGWWYVTNGKIDFTYTGLARNKYGWWYMTNGALDLTYTGLADNPYGTWYVENGTIALDYTGNVTIDGVSYVIKNGKMKYIMQ